MKYQNICFKSDGTEATGQKIIAKLIEMGGHNVEDFEGVSECSYYFINNDGEIEYEGSPGTRTVKSIDEVKPEKTFPRVMRVWDNDKSQTKNMVVADIDYNCGYPVRCYMGISTIEGIIKGQMYPVHYKNAEEIEGTESDDIKTELKSILTALQQILTKL